MALEKQVCEYIVSILLVNIFTATRLSEFP